MNNTIWSDEVVQFITEHMDSPTHRRMFHLGSVNVKVCGMFMLTGEEEPPPEAREAAELLLLGLMSGDADEYKRCEAAAMARFHVWAARRELH